MTDLRDLLADIDHHLTQIRRELQPALASMAGQATSGFPTSTRPGPGVTSPGHGDPVPTTVTNTRPGQRTTQHHPDRHHLDQAIHNAEKALASAHGIVHRHTPPGQAQPDEGTPGCTSCNRLGIYTDRSTGRGDLCNWCYRYRTCHPSSQQIDMPDRQLLAAYHERGKVTTNDFRRLDLNLPGQPPRTASVHP